MRLSEVDETPTLARCCADSETVVDDVDIVVDDDRGQEHDDGDDSLGSWLEEQLVWKISLCRELVCQPIRD